MKKIRKIIILCLVLVFTSLIFSKTEKFNSDELKQKIHSDNKMERREGIRVLGLLKDPNDFNFLVNLLHYDENFVSKNTILAIGDFGDKKGINILLGLYFSKSTKDTDNDIFDYINLALIKIDKNWRKTPEAKQSFDKYLNIIKTSPKMNCLRKKSAFKTMLYINKKECLKYSESFLKNKEFCLIALSAKNLSEFNKPNSINSMIDSIELLYKKAMVNDLELLIDSIEKLDKNWVKRDSSKKVLTNIRKIIMNKKEFNKNDAYVLRFYNDNKSLKILWKIINKKRDDCENSITDIAIESLFKSKSEKAINLIFKGLKLNKISITTEVLEYIKKTKAKILFSYILKKYKDNETRYWKKKYIFNTMLILDREKLIDFLIDEIENKNNLDDFAFLIKDRRVFNAIKKYFIRKGNFQIPNLNKFADYIVNFFSNFNKKEDRDFYYYLVNKLKNNNNKTVIKLLISIMSNTGDKRFESILKEYSNSDDKKIKLIAKSGLMRLKNEK